MATRIVGCGKEFLVGEIIVGSTPSHGSSELVFEAWHSVAPFCGMVSYIALQRRDTKQLLGKHLFRALCKDCAVKDGISW